MKIHAARKKEVLIAVPSLSGAVHGSIAKMFFDAGVLNNDPRHPFLYSTLVLEGHSPHAFARNVIIRDYFYSPGYHFHRLYQVDADMEVPPNWSALLEHDRPAVSGLAFGWKSSAGGKRAPELQGVQYEWGDDGNPKTANIRATEPFEVGAVGAACLVLSREILEQVKRTEPGSDGKPRDYWFKRHEEPDGETRLGEDMGFFEHARTFGHKALIVPSVMFDHDKSVMLMDIARFGMNCKREAQKAIRAQILTPGIQREAVA